MSELAYHRLFDALAAVRAIDYNTSIQLHGNAAGVALRSWALAMRIDVVPRVGELPDRTWTLLEVTPPGEVGWLILVHLDDAIPTATATPEPEMEIPF